MFQLNFTIQWGRGGGLPPPQNAFSGSSSLGGRLEQPAKEGYLEFWGRANKLARLSEAVFVAMESGMPDVKILLDPFHMYTGGSELNGLQYVTGANIGIVHVNDYPAVPGREQITDRDRVFPGEGIAPTRELARLLHRFSASTRATSIRAGRTAT